MTFGKVESLQWLFIGQSSIEGQQKGPGERPGPSQTEVLGRFLSYPIRLQRGAMFPVDHHGALAQPARRGQAPLELPSVPMPSALRRRLFLVRAFQPREFATIARVLLGYWGGGPAWAWNGHPLGHLDRPHPYLFI